MQELIASSVSCSFTARGWDGSAGFRVRPRHLSSAQGLGGRFPGAGGSPLCVRAVTFDAHGTLAGFRIYQKTQEILADRLPMEGVDTGVFLAGFRVMRFQAVLGPYRATARYCAPPCRPPCGCTASGLSSDGVRLSPRCRPSALPGSARRRTNQRPEGAARSWTAWVPDCARQIRRASRCSPRRTGKPKVVVGTEPSL